MSDSPQKDKNALNQNSEQINEDIKAKEALLEVEKNNEVLKNFDAFEVQDMPESNELQERRRRIKNQLKDLEVDADSADGTAPFSEDDEGSFLDLIREAGLGTRQLKFCCGAVLMLAIVIGLAYGVYQLVNGNGFSFQFWNWGDSNPQEEPVKSGEPLDPDAESGLILYPDPTVWMGMQLGELEESETGTTEAGEDLGLESNRDDALVAHIRDFSEVFEAGQVDVNELLNNSSLRRETLRTYTEQLNYLEQRGLASQVKLRNESELLEQSFAAVEDQKNLYESRFFSELNELDAAASTSALNSFVGYSQELIRLRAHYLARQKLLDYYDQTLPFLDAKRRDIELNTEALVKGIKVVEVDGSDLNLILIESDL